MMKELFKIYRDIEKSMSTTIRIDHSQVLHIVCADLMSKYKANRNGEYGAAFEKVLRFYLDDSEFEKLQKEIE